MNSDTSPPVRAELALDPAACTSCMICVRECPTWCITLEAHQEEREVGIRRPIKVNILDSFTVDYGSCMFCGICVDVCPHDALFWAPPAVEISAFKIPAEGALAENVLNWGAVGSKARQNLVYDSTQLAQALPRAVRTSRRPN